MGVQIESKVTPKRVARALVLLTLLVFCRVPGFNFINLDDPRHLDSNPYYKPTPLSHLDGVWKEPYLLYMPLTYTVWAFVAWASPSPHAQEMSITGVNRHFAYAPMFFHVTNLTLHLLSVLLVFLILLRFFPTLAAGLGAALFAIHPVQVEPVVWVSGLKDTLSGAFFFLALLLSLKSTAQTKRSLLFLTGALVAYLCALLSKPNVIVFPFVLFFVLRFLEKLDWKRATSLSLPFLIIAVPFAWITAQLQADNTLMFVPISFFKRPFIALDTLGFYMAKILVPFGLALDYGRVPEVALSGPPIYPLLGLLTLAVAGCLAYRQRERILEPAIFLICVAPVLGFKAFSFQTTSSVSDRYLYLALFAVSIGVARCFTASRVKLAPIALILAVLALRSFHQTGYWKDTPTLFTHNLEVNPRSWLVHNNFGSYLERTNQFDQALSHYQKAAELKSLNVFHNNMANIYLALRKHDFAAAQFRKATEINPLSSVDYAGLAFALKAKGDLTGAKAAFLHATQLNPNIPLPLWARN